MKIALIRDKVEARHGYLNIIDKEPQEDDSSIVMEYAVSNYLDFTGIVYNGEADELFIPSLIEYIPQETIGDYIRKWVEITAINGTITISGIEIFELITDFLANRLDETQINIILYSNNHKGCYSAEYVKTQLEAFNLKIEKVTINNGRYTIISRRV